MFKLIKNICLLSILAVTGFCLYRINTYPTRIIPYSYTIKDTQYKDLESAQNAHILILGDQMGKHMNKYLGEVKKLKEQKFQGELRVFNWSRENEGIHRTIHKLKQLKKFPPIIIYHTSSSEFYEAKFNIFDRSIISNNFSKYDNIKTRSLILTFPIISNFIYSKERQYVLDDHISRDKTESPGKLFFMKQELNYKLYEYELTELLSIIKEHNSTPILITAPINYQSPPSSCRITSSEKINEEINYLRKIVKEKKYKTVFEISKRLYQISGSNAEINYYLGLSLFNTGKTKEGRKFLQKSSAFSCNNERPNSIINNIVKVKAEKNQVTLIDFDLMINNSPFEEGLFAEALFPHNIFYEELIKSLIINIEQILKRLN